VDVLERFDPDDLDLIRRMLADHFSGVHLLAAPARPEQAELVRPSLFRAVLKLLRKAHDYVVVDLGTRYDQATQVVLDLADRVVFIITPEVTTIKNTHLLFKAHGFRDYKPEKVITILNQYNESWGLTPQLIGKAIGRPVNVVVPSDAAALRAVNRGRPVMLDSPRSPMVKPLLALEELLPDLSRLARELNPEAAGLPSPAPAHSERKPAGLDHLEERAGCARWIPIPGRWREALQTRPL
jgi:pilus assembly protein CpaE